MRASGANRTRIAWLFLVGLGLLVAPDPASAQPYDVPATWGGDIWSRPRLTGDWDGLRDELGKKGVVFDVDLFLTPQAVVSGGHSTGGDFWGNAEYTINLDSQKMGLWPGGFFKFSANSGFGSNVFRNSGAVIPVNTAALTPAPNDQTTALTNAIVTQFLSTKFGLFAGKIDTLDLPGQEFYGDYRTQFQNIAFLGPMTLQQVPISAYGGGVLGLPLGNEDMVLAAMALDQNGTPISNDLGHAFKDGAMVVGNGEVTIRPFGLVGHQALGFSWSDQNRFSLNQDPSNIARLLLNDTFPRLGNPGPILEKILARFFPGLVVPTKPANRMNSSWSINYSFDQYLWQPEGDPKHGIGVFFSFGASDGNPNPIKYAFFAGIGGKGVVPGRPDDSFGLGIARTQFSSDFVPFLRQKLNLGLEHEDALEMYYNVSITKWLNATADLQIIDPALKKQLSSSGGVLPRLSNVDTPVVLGLYLRARF
jgi:porin